MAGVSVGLLRGADRNYSLFRQDRSGAVSVAKLSIYWFGSSECRNLGFRHLNSLASDARMSDFGPEISKPERNAIDPNFDHPVCENCCIQWYLELGQAKQLHYG